MKQRAIFICTGNSCRSQIAEGLLRKEAGDRFDIFSAGSHPSRVHPAAISVMEEWGIDISHQKSKSIDNFIDNKSFNKLNEAMFGVEFPWYYNSSKSSIIHQQPPQLLMNYWFFHVLGWNSPLSAPGP